MKVLSHITNHKTHYLANNHTQILFGEMLHIHLVLMQPFLVIEASCPRMLPIQNWKSNTPLSNVNGERSAKYAERRAVRLGQVGLRQVMFGSDRLG